MKKGRILTGHRPTGARHIGHLAGTLENWARLQDDYECFFLVADLHVLTTDYEHPARVRENSLEIVLDWLAAGIDPERSTLVLQSAVPAHTQLAMLLSMLVTVSRLNRVPTYKEQVRELGLQPSMGLLAYPVLQAADIMIYKADAVPVGEDQLPHIELTRELARTFNRQYGETFPEPEGLLSSTPRLPGTDNRTMHTSYGNQIYLRDTPEETTRKIMSMYTDPTRIHATDPGHVEGNPVFIYHDTFNRNKEEVEELKARYVAGKVGDVEVKKRLAKALNEYLAPLRERRAELAAHPDDVIDILRDGTRRAQEITQQVLEEAQEKMGLAAGLMKLPEVAVTGGRKAGNAAPAYFDSNIHPNFLYVP
ncbi:MAG: tryptophan--tRNA ligase [Chloroflexi bacterium]|nr:tryptophan--tRNA ligase [Chloroflexota bacterium]